MAAGNVQKSIRSMQRIISLPLVQPAPSKIASSSTALEPLTYYQFQIHKSLPTDPKSKEGYMKYVNWAQEKAISTWAGFGKKKEGSWQLRVYNTGERIVDRIDFEELALKGVDPSLGPKIMQWTTKNKLKEKQAHEVQIPLLYPPSIQTGDASISQLRRLLEHRTPKHKKGFWIWMIAAPFTAPVMIIPVIPNLPFFFCVWRSWSHYRAYKASEYLKALVENGTIVPEASATLDTIYKDYQPKRIAKVSPSPPSQQTGDSPHPPPDESTTTSSTDSSSTSESSQSNVEPDVPEATNYRILLTRPAAPAIKQFFDMGAGSEGDIIRAMEQAEMRTQKKKNN